MRAVPQPDLRPLQQPLSRGALREARRWRRRSAGTDVARIGLRVAGGALLAAGALVLLGAIADGFADAAMGIVGCALAAGGAALLVWSIARSWRGLRLDTRLLAFAAANEMAYGAHVLTDPKPGTLFRLGLMHESVRVLRAPDGAELGVWELRTHPRAGTERWGYLELPVLPLPGQVLAIALDEGRPPATSALRQAAELALVRADQARRPAARAQGPHHELVLLDDPRAAERLPAGLLDLLQRSGRRLDAEAVADRLVVMQRGGWDLADPDLQGLVHRIRSLVAASGAQPDALPHRSDATSPAPIASTAAGRASRRRALGAVLLSTCGLIAVAFLAAWLRSLG